ncbi:hypothetical protein BKA69DRAFT_1065020 [Paraphysoderma sedebokerense]|nr:hypothetical protein BKA69DRAFT_1065020 [Paraphysoderma sedebokerense]
MSMSTPPRHLRKRIKVFSPPPLAAVLQELNNPSQHDSDKSTSRRHGLPPWPAFPSSSASSSYSALKAHSFAEYDLEKINDRWQLVETDQKDDIAPNPGHTNHRKRVFELGGVQSDIRKKTRKVEFLMKLESIIATVTSDNNERLIGNMEEQDLHQQTGAGKEREEDQEQGEDESEFQVQVLSQLEFKHGGFTLFKEASSSSGEVVVGYATKPPHSSQDSFLAISTSPPAPITLFTQQHVISDNLEQTQRSRPAPYLNAAENLVPPANPMPQSDIPQDLHNSYVNSSAAPVQRFSSLYENLPPSLRCLSSLEQLRSSTSNAKHTILAIVTSISPPQHLHIRNGPSAGQLIEICNLTVTDASSVYVSVTLWRDKCDWVRESKRSTDHSSSEFKNGVCIGDIVCITGLTVKHAPRTYINTSYASKLFILRRLIQSPYLDPASGAIPADSTLSSSKKNPAIEPKRNAGNQLLEEFKVTFRTDIEMLVKFAEEKLMLGLLHGGQDKNAVERDSSALPLTLSPLSPSNLYDHKIFSLTCKPLSVSRIPEISISSQTPSHHSSHPHSIENESSKANTQGGISEEGSDSGGFKDMKVPLIVDSQVPILPKGLNSVGNGRWRVFLSDECGEVGILHLYETTPSLIVAISQKLNQTVLISDLKVRWCEVTVTTVHASSSNSLSRTVSRRKNEISTATKVGDSTNYIGVERNSELLRHQMRDMKDVTMMFESMNDFWRSFCSGYAVFPSYITSVIFFPTPSVALMSSTTFIRNLNQCDSIKITASEILYLHRCLSSYSTSLNSSTKTFHPSFQLDPADLDKMNKLIDTILKVTTDICLNCFSSIQKDKNEIYTCFKCLTHGVKSSKLESGVKKGWVNVAFGISDSNPTLEKSESAVLSGENEGSVELVVPLDQNLVYDILGDVPDFISEANSKLKEFRFPLPSRTNPEVDLETLNQWIKFLDNWVTAIYCTMGFQKLPNEVQLDDAQRQTRNQGKVNVYVCSSVSLDSNLFVMDRQFTIDKIDGHSTP